MLSHNCYNTNMRNRRLITIFSILLGITLFVLLGSIIFSVKTVNTRCLNYAYSDEEIEVQILENTNIPKGQSIIFVSEEKIINSIQENVPNVKVINIERKFPNRITIHFIKLFDYFEVYSGGHYYTLTHEGRVTKKLDTPQPKDKKITIVSKSSDRLSVGDYLYADSKRQILSEIVSCLERLDLAEQKATTRFDFIDIETNDGCLYLGISGSKNLIKIADIFDVDTLFDKIRLGYSTYISPAFDRMPNQMGQYRMVYVVSPNYASNPYNAEYPIS